ncbi:RPA12 [Enterospora canceri]|uniref:DNA-directed RNA polymerase subunit n=1 Tax=Enterospora canceri TaxID=1081671 RepID=A0A1Y1S5E2_9MICR|nr:RPA12 [Enterospora canceri]
MFCECGTFIIITPGELINNCRRCRKVITEEKIASFSYKEERQLLKDDVEKEERVEKARRTRICPKCGNNEMFFHTLQTRSADEGQTVFYECTACGTKERLNS